MSASASATSQGATAHSGSKGASQGVGLSGTVIGLSASGTKLSTFSVHLPALARSLGTVSGRKVVCSMNSSVLLADAARFEVVDPVVTW